MDSDKETSNNNENKTPNITAGIAMQAIGIKITNNYFFVAPRTLIIASYPISKFFLFFTNCSYFIEFRMVC